MSPKRAKTETAQAVVFRRDPWLAVLIFVTGGAILSLELLASRIMTPYFGVSLYIWAAILSITLVALALGYWLGGKAAASGPKTGAPAVHRLLRLFLLMPIIAGLALGCAALLYPSLFPGLARYDLVLGSVIASFVLLLIPLIATSAMNPLLVALGTARRGAADADAGAGRVFFVSTLGSVVGVPVTAFLLIPYFSNFASVLGVGTVLSVLALAGVLLYRGELPVWRTLAALGGLGVVLCGGLLLFADAWLGRTGPIAFDGLSWRIEREYRSVFGNIKILRTDVAQAPGGFVRTYFQDGIVQNRTDGTGRSLSLFTYALESIGLGFKPDARSALVLGLGAGIIPERLAKRGVAVEIVEINPGSWAAARDFFGLDPTKFQNHEVDARTFVDACEAKHDLVLVDLFQGDGIPEHLLTREFFAGLRRCLAPGGAAVFNSFAESDNPDSYIHLLATLQSVFGQVAIFGGGRIQGESAQTFVLATDAPIPDNLKIAEPEGLPPLLEPTFAATFARVHPVTPEMVRGGRVVTDGANFLPWANVKSFLAYRRIVVEYFPPALLVN